MALEATVAADAIRRHAFKLVVDYSFGATALVMPTLLGKLGADVLAVNPYVSTASRVNFDPVAARERVAGLVRASGAHLGAILDADGERLTLIDDEGRILSHTEALLAFVELVRDHLLGDRIALPVSATQAASVIASAHNVEVVPTKISIAALMAVAKEPSVGFASDAAGGYILPGFLPAFDAAGALLKILDLLARHDRTLAEVVDGLPKVHLNPRDRDHTVGAEGPGHAESHRDGGTRCRAHRRRQGDPLRWLGARAAGPGRSGHAHLGRGRKRCRCTPPGAGILAQDSSAPALRQPQFVSHPLPQG